LVAKFGFFSICLLSAKDNSVYFKVKGIEGNNITNITPKVNFTRTAHGVQKSRNLKTKYKKGKIQLICIFDFWYLIYIQIVFFLLLS